jgi:hypothetical protein
MLKNHCRLLASKPAFYYIPHQQMGVSHLVCSIFMGVGLSIFSLSSIHFCCQFECIRTLTWGCGCCSFVINVVSICSQPSNDPFLVTYHRYWLSQKFWYWNCIHIPGNTILFINRCFGGGKYALNMVDNNLNNFCSPSLSFLHMVWCT